MLENFKLDTMYINNKYIPYKFTNNIYNFIDKLSELNTYRVEIKNFFINCLNERNKDIEKQTKCLNYIEPNNIKNVQKKIFAEWCEIYLFK
jgi:hypothetical protein